MQTPEQDELLNEIRKLRADVRWIKILAACLTGILTAVLLYLTGGLDLLFGVLLWLVVIALVILWGHRMARPAAPRRPATVTLPPKRPS